MDPRPILLPLGDAALLVRFASRLDEAANASAIRLSDRLCDALPPGVVEVVPNLVSVLVRYDPTRRRFEEVAGEVRMILSALPEDTPLPGANHRIAVRFGGEGGPDLADVASRLDLTEEAFVAAHNAAPLRVLATGFAPGFVYCGLHSEALRVPRRADVRARVPAGTVLFAAGQTAITATPIPTGWHVIGQTDFRNFDPVREEPTILKAGDQVTFEAVPA